MAEQIRMTLTLDDATKLLAEQSAREFCEGNVSAYVRGLVVLHHLLLGRPTGKADYPGWMLEQFPLDMLAIYRQAVRDYRDSEREANEPHYNEDDVWVDGRGKPVPTVPFDKSPKPEEKPSRKKRK